MTFHIFHCFKSTTYFKNWTTIVLWKLNRSCILKSSCSWSSWCNFFLPLERTFEMSCHVLNKPDRKMVYSRPTGHLCVWHLSICVVIIRCVQGAFSLLIAIQAKNVKQVLLSAVEWQKLLEKGMPGCKDAVWDEGRREANKVKKDEDAVSALTSKVLILSPHSKFTSNPVCSKWSQRTEHVKQRFLVKGLAGFLATASLFFSSS